MDYIARQYLNHCKTIHIQTFGLFQDKIRQLQNDIWNIAIHCLDSCKVMFYNCKTIFNKCKSIYLKKTTRLYLDCWKTMRIWTIVEEYLNYCKTIFDNSTTARQYQTTEDNIWTTVREFRQLQAKI